MRLLESLVSRFTHLLLIIFVLLEASANTNIILIVTDDQRWDATGFMQGRMSSLGRTARFPWMQNNTPNLDRLSEEGIHFDNGYGVYSLCSPARATMLTGQYPHKHGITNNQTDFPSDVPTYASLLQSAGYTTGYFGKWHMGTQNERPGFEHVRTFYGQGKYFGTVFNDENGNPLSSNTTNPQSEQSIVINVTDLPSGGAIQSSYRTLLNGSGLSGAQNFLSVGVNSFSIDSDDFDRGVFFRFTSGEIQFDSLVYNGEQLLSNPGVPTTVQASSLFEAVSNNASYPYRIGITAAGVSTWGSSSTSEWIDDTSTNYAIEFIEDQASSGNPFMLFLGFKTPHEGTQNGLSNWYPPVRTDGIFSGQSSVSVPNLGVSPPFAPGVTGGNSGNITNQNYCETIAGIDGCVGNILEAVQAAGLDDSTAIIFISDNGFFRGEHGLSDKRAAYEESIRLPFMIRHPSLQTTSGLIVNEIVSNLDIAPTILDLAGLPIPSSMQGASLVPFIRGEVPNNWRDQLFIEYHHDAEFPTANVRPYISLIHENGLKIVSYQEDASWNELFNTNASVDPYEINNIISSGALVDQQNRATMEELLIKESYNTDFLKILRNNIINSGGSITLSAGEGSPFKLESSADLLTWEEEGSFEGDNEPVTISAINSMGFSGQTFSYTTTLNGQSLEPFSVSFGTISLYNYPTTSSITYRDLLYDNTFSPTSWSIQMGTLNSPATVTVEFLPTPDTLSSGTYSEYDLIQTDIWDASVDVLGQSATFKQVAQVPGVTSGEEITGYIGTNRDEGYIELAAMRVTIDYNPGQLRYNIDFGSTVFDSDDNDSASGFGTNYYTWNTATGNSVSLNPFSAADPSFGDYASISTTATIDSQGSESAVNLTTVSEIGDNGDHVLRSGSQPAAIDAYAYSTLAVGSTSSDPSGGRNAVLIFELPGIESDQQIHSATLAVTVERLNQRTDFDADLWSLGIYDSNGTDPDGDGKVEYHERPTGNTTLVKLQDAFLNDLIAGTDSETDSVRVTSSQVSRLSDYLWQFYNSNPNYSGGKYLHLRVSPEIGSINDIGGEDVRYTIKAAHSANDNAEKPKLTINLKDKSDVSQKRFYRIRYGEY